jgi:hypothetical protein
MTGITMRLDRTHPSWPSVPPIRARTAGDGSPGHARPPIGQTQLPVSSHDETALNKEPAYRHRGALEGDNNKGTQTSCNGDGGSGDEVRRRAGDFIGLAGAHFQ